MTDWSRGALEPRSCASRDCRSIPRRLHGPMRPRTTTSSPVTSLPERSKRPNAASLSPSQNGLTPFFNLTDLGSHHATTPLSPHACSRDVRRPGRSVAAVTQSPCPQRIPWLIESRVIPSLNSVIRYMTIARGGGQGKCHAPPRCSQALSEATDLIAGSRAGASHPPPAPQRPQGFRGTTFCLTR